MTKRIKALLIVLAIALIGVSVYSHEYRLLAQGAALYFLSWVLWRAFVFLFVLCKPIRERLKPVDAHVTNALRQTGLGALADAGQKLQSGLEGAVAATQKQIDERKP